MIHHNTVSESKLYIIGWENRYSLEMDLLPFDDHRVNYLFSVIICNGVIDMGIFMARIRDTEECRKLKTEAYQNWIYFNHEKLPYFTENKFKWENL